MLYSELAYEIAKQAHMGQKDKAGVDYIHHPETVASMMETDIEKSVAYLHDVVEDTTITLEMLKAKGFSNEVINAVNAITKRAGEEYNEYLHRVAENPIAFKVKLADMKHNSNLNRFENPTSENVEKAKSYKRKIQDLKKIYEKHTNH
ncbi:MAG: GTP pyrophosphokinase [Erysipelotrichaceae bacterium]